MSFLQISIIMISKKIFRKRVLVADGREEILKSRRSCENAWGIYTDGAKLSQKRHFSARDSV